MASSEFARTSVSHPSSAESLSRSDLWIERGDFVFQQGAPCESLFRIISGRVALTIASDAGKEALLDILGPGDWLGERVLLGSKVRNISAKALSRTEVARFTVDSMKTFLEREPEFAFSLIHCMFVRLARYEEALCHHLLEDVEHRLAAALLQLSHDASAQIPKVSQELLAEMVGTTRSRVNHFMMKFRRLGYIDYRGGYIDVKPGLKTLAGRPVRT